MNTEKDIRPEETPALLQRPKIVAREFYSFITHQGIIGLAVGFVFGAAISDLVASLVSDIIDPFLNLLIPGGKLESATFVVGSATIAWGKFASAILDFLVVAIIVFVMMRYLHLKVEPKVSIARR